MVATIQSLMGCKGLPPDVRNSARGEIPNQYLSAKKARDVLGWTATFSLTSGLRETIEWYRRLDSLSAPERA
jgi:CDP-glucose 4,6-dehydratase